MLLYYLKYDYEYFIIYFFKCFFQTFLRILAKFYIDTQLMSILLDSIRFPIIYFYLVLVT